MKSYNLQEQIVTIDTFASLIKRNILPLGVDISDTPNNLDSNVLDILNTYYQYNDVFDKIYQERNGVMTLNLVKLEDDYAERLINLKKYIRVNPDTGDIVVYKVEKGISSVRCLACYVSVYIKPYFSVSKDLEIIYLQDKTEVILDKYLIKEKSRTL